MVKMGSQTLEILRQGIWASVTGGWFYDPHQNIFCNAVHLYLWLFLLCLPFTIYLYFPPSFVGWCIYCTLVAVLISFLKLLNHGLHHMYDNSECIIIPTENPNPTEKKQPQKKQRDDEGIEMQMLGTSRISSVKQQTDNESVTSLEYHKPIKTMDLKVDVHRKNSSESSMEDNSGPHRSVVETVSVHRVDPGAGPSNMPSTSAQTSSSKSRSRPSSSRRDHRRWLKSQKHNEDSTERSKIEEISSEESLRMEHYSKTEDTVAINLDDDGPTTKVSRKLQAGRSGSHGQDFYKEWLYLDASEAGEPYRSKFARRLSSDSRDNSEVSANGARTSPVARRSRGFGSHRGTESCTKSAIALAQPDRSDARRNSNSAASSIQLPLLNSTAQLVSELRRHSNANDASLGFLPTGSVELGAYLAKMEAPARKGKSKSKSKMPGVRRIKSAALEIGCLPPSVSNLSPHPNSVEAIGGQVLKNPKSAILPPPSETLMRNPHLNLWPKSGGSDEAYPYANYGSEIVYPIAEISDEMQTSQCQDGDLDSASGASYADYEDDHRRLRGFDSDFNRPLEINSSDTEYENNGSRSPLLDRIDRLNDIKIVKAKGDKRSDDRSVRKNNSFSIESKNCSRNEKISKNHSFNVATSTAEDVEITLRNNENVAPKRPTKLKTFTSCDDRPPERRSADSDDRLSKKKTDLEISNSSVSLEMQDARSEGESDSYGFSWLFDETVVPPKIEPVVDPRPVDTQPVDPRPGPSRPPGKNLGAIPKQIRNFAKLRTFQKESRSERAARERAAPYLAAPPPAPTEEEVRQSLRAQAELVRGLETLFAVTKASAIAMPTPGAALLEDKRAAREHARRERSARRRRSDEPAPAAVLPTSMPLLAAFLNSRPDLPPIPLYLQPDRAGPSTRCDYRLIYDPPHAAQTRPSRPANERSHKLKIRKMKRSSRQRNAPPTPPSIARNKYSRRRRAPTDATTMHVATSFDDTTDGAIHTFRDEYGNWMSYAFDKASAGEARPAAKAAPADSDDEAEADAAEDRAAESAVARSDAKRDAAEATASCSVYSSSNPGSNNPLISSDNVSTSTLPVPASADAPRSESFAERGRLGLPTLQMNFLLGGRNIEIPPQPSLPISTIGQNVDLSQPSLDRFAMYDVIAKFNKKEQKSYYKFDLSKCWQIKVTMDRLKLLALFDRNLTFKETFLSIMLSIMVAVLGATVLHIGFYRHIYAFWFCFIMAGSQYSLLKSVQPDSASPIHGFNKMVVFSRPIYFCLCSALMCGIHYQLEAEEALQKTTESISIFGLYIRETDLLIGIQVLLSNFILFFPLAFSLGLFPQINTFLMYLFEQIDMHIFGGNATASLSASIYCVTRSLLAIGVLYGFAYGGLTEAKSTQHILFSMFCALVVPVSYHLSRSASDYSSVWNLIKTHLLPPDLYSINSAESSNVDLGKQAAETVSEKSSAKNKNNSESNISKQHSIGSSASKINFSSETNISKNQKRSQTSSVSSLKMESRVGDNLNSSGSIKMDTTANEGADSVKFRVTAEEKNDEDNDDPLPRKLQETVNSRFKNDVIVCAFMAIFIFGIHCTTVFSTLQPELNPIVWSITVILGWHLHYLMPQFRKQQPWLWLSGPVLKSHEYAQFEVHEPARVMWFEKAYVYLCFVERNILYPVIFISAATQDSAVMAAKFGPAIGSLLVCICALKCVRNAYSDTDNQYLILIFTVLLFRLDISWASETFLMDYFLMAIIFNKTYEFLLKIQFVVTYIAPWQITWGSAFHAFAQPFSVPHSAMLFLQALISAILSTPLNPVLGSAIFMTSYVRPVKFWERDYNTKRVDTTNTRLSSQLERNLGSDDNNLNSIFYEHLTRSLQHYLCGDLSLGRWGQVQQGDCFVLASDYLNCLVHIVEIGNGLVSFQLRGLEFRGTYCQQREVEAISEGPEENDGCCCCAVGHLPRMLSVNAMFSLRWLAWQLTSAKYVLEGYSISDNSAVSMLQVFDFRKVLITYYVKSIIFYTTQSPKLEEWLSSPSIMEALKPTHERNFVDLDPIFNVNLDEDYDFRASGITRTSFCTVYQEWISYCGSRREDLYRKSGERMTNKESPLMSLCFALSLIGRRSLVAASHNTVSSVEFFLFGLHALFKGDFRITCVRDEWVFSDMSLLHSVLAPAVRMALKLHQDHFMSPEEYGSCSALYSAIKSHTSTLVICHEAAPAWRANVLRGAPHLLALRHVMDDGSDEYKIIMLNKRQLSFRVIKLNRECVRGLWAGQQQELIYLRNRNPERGSIQNAKQALRNIINSSCDQPIGYPIYVSPLTTSYAETSLQLTGLVGAALTLGAIRKKAVNVWRKIRRRCGEGCSSGSAAAAECGAAVGSGSVVGAGGSSLRGPHHVLRRPIELSRTSLAGTRGSLASVGKPTSSTLASLAGLLGSSREHSLGPHLEREGIRERAMYYDRDGDSAAYTTIRETTSESRVTIREGAPGEREDGGRSSVRERDNRQVSLKQQLSRDGRQSSIKDRSREGARRSKRDRDRIRPASFRMLSAQERDGNVPSASFHNDGCELHSLRDERESSRGGIFREKDSYDVAEKETKMAGSSKDKSFGYKDVRRTASSSSKTSSHRPATPDTSSEDLNLNFVMTANGCQIIANRSVNQKYPLPYSNRESGHKRRSSDASASSQAMPLHHSEKCIDNLQSSKDLRNAEYNSSSEQSVLRRTATETPKELTKANREMKLDRESVVDLTGKYNELSSKECHLRFPPADGSKDDKPSKVRVKRSESLRSELKSQVSVGCKVVIVDPSGVFDSVNLGRRADVLWPTEYAREKGGKNVWGMWYPTEGMDGEVIHRWLPNHRDPKQRSHTDKTILLVRVDDKFVPISENCVQDLGDEV